jgi:hypothetical protein
MHIAARRRNSGSSGAAAGAKQKASPLLRRALPLSAFAGEWPLAAALQPARVSVYGAAVRRFCLRLGAPPPP